MSDLLPHAIDELASGRDLDLERAAAVLATIVSLIAN